MNNEITINDNNVLNTPTNNMVSSFPFYEPELSNKITESGCENINKLLKMFYNERIEFKKNKRIKVDE